jgi:hypothetical protein
MYRFIGRMHFEHWSIVSCPLRYHRALVQQYRLAYQILHGSVSLGIQSNMIVIFLSLS